MPSIIQRIGYTKGKKHPTCIYSENLRNPHPKPEIQMRKLNCVIRNVKVLSWYLCNTVVGINLEYWSGLYLRIHISTRPIFENRYTVDFLIMHTVGKGQIPMHYENYALWGGILAVGWAFGNFGSTKILCVMRYKYMHYEEVYCINLNYISDKSANRYTRLNWK